MNYRGLAALHEKKRDMKNDFPLLIDLIMRYYMSGISVTR